jgi:hypothetical protein
MANLQIKNESLARRCEVCHQVDCYDPEIDRCSRCEQIADGQLKIWLRRAQGGGKLHAGHLTPYDWYNRAANIFMAASTVPYLFFFSGHFEITFLVSMLMLFFGITLVFLGLHALVNGATTAISMWKVLCGMLVVSSVNVIEFIK